MSRLAALQVHAPEECARRLGGISVAALVKLLRAGGYSYTSLQPGARPWGRGRQCWGMTDDQLAEVVRGQAQRHRGAAEGGRSNAAAPAAVAGLSALGWDGIDRLGLSRPRKKNG